MKRLLSFILILVSLSSFAQEFANRRTLHYSSNDGLSFGIINSITQDAKGFMWFATADGLNRFDGTTFKVFKFDPDNKSSISSNYVQKVFKDTEGIIWVSSRRGLNRFDAKTGKFIKYKFTSSNLGKDVSNISESRDGNLWIATSEDGFYYFNKKKKSIIRYNTETLPGLLSNTILNIYEDSSGLLWIGTKDNGVKVFKISHDKRLKSVNFDINGAALARINSVFEDHLNNIWIATAKGLLFYTRAENKFYTFSGNQFDFKNNLFLSLIEDGEKQLLIGVQDGGLYKFDLETSVKSKPEHFVFEQVHGNNECNITKQSIQSLYLDRDNNVWVGTYGSGLYMLSSIREKFKKHQKKKVDIHGENYIRYYGMCADADGNLWLGTDGNGIYKTTVSGKTLKHYEADGRKGSLTDNAILSAYKDSKNNLWFGSYSKGLFRYDRDTDSFVNYTSSSDAANGLKSNDVRVIYEDSSGTIWVGTNGGGLHIFDPASKKFTAIESSDSSLSPNDVRAIVEDKNGNLWIGAYGGGLNYFDVKTKRFYRRLRATEERNILSNNVVLSLHLDQKEQLWIGTEGDGLILYDTKSSNTRVFNESNGIANSTIYAIQEDSTDQIWVSTNKGLSQINSSANTIYNFDESDGLQGGQFKAGAAIYNEKENYMCFGGTEGWNIFYTKDVEKLSTYKPETHITGLQYFGKKLDDRDDWNILNKDLSETEEITLKPNQAVFSIHYIALNYTYPKEGEYAYKLEGLDKDWNYVKGQRSATYRYLDPGEYVFKVKASNQDLIWTDNYKSIKIRILPPWYKTWWAYLVYIGLGLFITTSYFRYKAKQARLKYKVKLAQIEAVKEKELNERKLSFFTNISHEFRSPLTLILNPVKELMYNNGQGVNTTNLNIVYRNAKRLLSLVDQLLLFSKKENEIDKLRVVKLNITDLCKEVFLCFTFEAKAKGINYEFITNDSPIELYGDREKIEIALYNLVSNALKFTPKEGSVRLLLSEADDSIIISVEDTGKGISENIGDKLFERFYQVRNVNHQLKGGFGIGLYLVKSVVDNHKGELRYNSKLGVGTTFEISLLKGRNHFNPTLIFEDVPEKSVFLEDLLDYNENLVNTTTLSEGTGLLGELSSDTKTILVIDDNADIRQYILQIFKDQFNLLEASNGDQGLELIKQYLPDLVISDVIMPGLNGIELCNIVKEDPALNHIPIILLTASSSSEIKLKGIEQGADDYISKPFDKAILRARVIGILKSHNNLQSYFLNEITLKPNHVKISGEDNEFLDRCIQIVENNIEDPDLGIKTLVEELAMSRSNLYNKIKSISGQSANSFIRFIRLRKAAELLISTDYTIYETADKVGIKDLRYFREQFKKVFHMNPSEYVKKYRSTFHENYNLNKGIIDIKSK